MTYQIFLVAGIPVLELYVELVPILTGLDMNSGHESGYENYVPEYEHVPEPVPEPARVSVSQSRPRPQCRTRPQTYRVSEPEPQPEPELDIPVDAIPDQYLDSGDQFGDGDEENWDADDLSDGDGDIPPPINQVFPISGRSSRHPVENFNDISAFQEADIAYFGLPRVFENELSEGQIFASRTELKKKISEFHVSKNIECRWEKSEPSRMIVKCKDNCCDFRLFAKPQGIGDAWVIKKCHFPHSCRTPASRTDHAQLTASIITDIIADTIKKDPCMSIQGVANCVSIKHNNVTPKYNRLWRGREVAIARQFGSWEGSYSLLEPLLMGICHKT